ncbi:MAG TPA: glycosyltransferase [Gammaproteobacteria bacterium]|nr:glycosyltransferase [Gammaproteobacteria bacterium]
MPFPTASILCSSYNSARYIDGYCRSLNNQLLPRFNVIYVDAASTDTSLERFKLFKFRDGIEVTIIECAEKVPIYQAWNMAIEVADTDYCMNFNTDDRLYPAALRTLLEYANVWPNVDVIYSRCYIVDDPDHHKIVNLFDWPEYSHSNLVKMCLCGPFPLLKRQTIIDAGLFNPEYSIVGDYEMWLRLSRRGSKFRKIPETIGSYFNNPAGLSTDKSLEVERTRQVHDIQEKYR